MKMLKVLSVSALSVCVSGAGMPVEPHVPCSTVVTMPDSLHSVKVCLNKVEVSWAFGECTPYKIIPAWPIPNPEKYVETIRSHWYVEGKHLFIPCLPAQSSPSPRTTSSDPSIYPKIKAVVDSSGSFHCQYLEQGELTWAVGGPEIINPTKYCDELYTFMTVGQPFALESLVWKPCAEGYIGGFQIKVCSHAVTLFNNGDIQCDSYTLRPTSPIESPSEVLAQIKSGWVASTTSVGSLCKLRDYHDERDTAEESRKWSHEVKFDFVNNVCKSPVTKSVFAHYSFHSGHRDIAKGYCRELYRFVTKEEPILASVLGIPK
jgi:hypothetical protein